MRKYPASNVQCRICDKYGHLARVYRKLTVLYVRDTNASDLCSTNQPSDNIRALNTRSPRPALHNVKSKLPLPGIRTFYFEPVDNVHSLKIELDSASPIANTLRFLPHPSCHFTDSPVIVHLVVIQTIQCPFLVLYM
ncbi:hypothetical protein FGIG_03769 [Fasciola gigantica]|uniref:Uncharacterized protein n=1 Tax=Fasciola gigantica TaxID=46835 RepID=A0A504Z162_FASGI|nr:hypothetical protein FGIG_03769 [Fasciola gigantica]